MPLRALTTDSSICWFCSKNSSDHIYSVKMDSRRLVGGGPGYQVVESKRTTVNIPRCRKCASVHRWVVKMRICYGVFLFLILISSIYIESAFQDPLGIPLKIILSVLALSPVYGTLLFELKIRSHKKKKWPGIKDTSKRSLSNHPRVLMMLALGLKFTYK